VITKEVVLARARAGTRRAGSEASHPERLVPIWFHAMLRIVGGVLFALWCFTWQATMVGMLTERFDRKPTPEENTVKAVCVLNAAIY
jgi:hypothetical protein